MTRLLDRVSIGLLMALALMLGSCEPAYPAEVSEVIIQTIAMESADQPFEGQVAVASIIINRARRAGKSLEWVVLRPRQFSCWNSPKWAFSWLSRHYDSKARSTALKALEMAINAKEGHTRLTHYHTLDVMPYWAKGHKPALQIGRHLFYEGIK